MPRKETIVPLFTSSQVRFYCLLAFAGRLLAQATPNISTVDDLISALIDAKTEEEQSTLIAERSGLITPELASKIHDEGHHLREGGSLDRARSAYTATVKISEQLGDEPRVARALGNIGIVHGMQGSYAKALQFLQKSLALYEARGDRERMLDSLTNIGNVYRWQLDFEQALATHQRALSLAEQVNDKRRIAVPCLNIGIIRSEQADSVGALQYLERGLSLMRELKDERNVAFALVGIGNVHASLGRHAEAISAFEEALGIQETLGDKYGAVFALASIAYQELGRGRAEQAIPPAVRAMTMAQQGGFRESLWRAATTIGYSHMEMARYVEARAGLQQAIDTIEEMRQELVGDEREQQRFFSDKLEPYWGMLQLMVAQGKTADALAFAERAKARVLLDVSRSGRSRITQTMTESERERERQLGRTLAAATSQLRRESPNPQVPPARLMELSKERDRARLEYDNYQIQLYAGHPELKAKRGELDWTGADATAHLLNDDTAIVEFAVTPKRTYGFVLTRESNGGTDLRSWTIEISRAELARQTEQMRRSMANRDLDFRRHAAKLYDLLLQPAAALLSGKRTLVIVPDGVLWEMPFQALDKHGRYLLEDHVVLYAPSLAVLEAMGRMAANPRVEPKILAVGNPELGRSVPADRPSRGEYAVLPDAEREVQMLGTIYGPHRSTVWTGAAATESNVRSEAAKYSILHFATHGLRDQSKPMHSHIVLAHPRSGGSDDGLLEAWELMNMELSAKLVVLSACETALGEVGAGEGMIGLTWALFIAGTPTVVASQWRVNSRSTTDLMIGMYRELLKPSYSLESSLASARALRTSALRLLRNANFAHPFYWAGFVAIGGRL